MKKNEKNRMRFNEWIKSQRLKHKDVAAHLGINYNALHNLLGGQFMPSLKTAAMIELLTKGKIKATDWVDLSDVQLDVQYVEEKKEVKEQKNE